LVLYSNFRWTTDPIQSTKWPCSPTTDS